ncbi:hypothetical protein [Pedobacter nutrimenti]|uniref:hypothetical protein n=1 Tax=Pedobacter nutrimenti TaxID=1241337 RepID=UPI00292E9A79|nr:hypothetical protein [Pedobacter nutrimenti]
MKSIYLFIFSSLLVSLILSCGTKESIQRDINIETDSISFTFPVVTDTISTSQNLASISTTVSLDNIIKTQTNEQFSIADLRTAHIIGFKIKLSKPDTSQTNYNNLRVYSTLALGLSSATGNVIPVGVLNNNPDLYSTGLSIPVTNTGDLKSTLNSNVTYLVTGEARRKNTKIMAAKAVIQYQITVGR